MSLTEIPSKIIERTESITETKLFVAAELTKIVYSGAKEHVSEEKILKSYYTFYKGIKDLAPPPLEQIKQHGINIYYIIFLAVLLIVAFIYAFPWLRQWL